jgi:hypothetical protein
MSMRWSHVYNSLAVAMTSARTMNLLEAVVGEWMLHSYTTLQAYDTWLFFICDMCHSSYKGTMHKCTRVC